METGPHPFAVSVLLLCLLANNQAAADTKRAQVVTGPVAAEVVRVIDGDTILVLAQPWPQHSVEVYVRLRGIDAPETRSQCPSLREMAKTAQVMLQELIAGDRRIFLTDIEGDKFFGRVVADVYLSNGRNPAHDMIAAGLANIYQGGKKHRSHCPEQVTSGIALLRQDDGDRP